MSAARAAIRAPGAASAARGHIHLPSIHVRDEDGGGFDYEEDIYLHGRGMRRRAERVIHFAVIEQGRETMARVTGRVMVRKLGARSQRRAR